MLIERVERIADAKGEDTHEAVVKFRTESGHEEIRCIFPDYSVGMEVEKKRGKYILTGGMNLTDHSIQIIHDNGLFFYETKDFLSFKEIRSICSTKSNAYTMFKNNPFCLVSMEKPGSSKPYASFPVIDAHFTPSTWEKRLSEYRYAAKHILECIENEGHTYIEYKDFKDRFLTLLNRNGHPMRIGDPAAVLRYFSNEFYLETPFCETSRVAFLSTYRKEMDILDKIAYTKNMPTLYSRFQPSNLDGLTDEQKNAVVGSILSQGRISILTGGPGTGKTTVLRQITQTMNEMYPGVEIRLMAPTGRAAKRIEEVMGDQEVEVSTIHKFLGFGKEFVTKEDREKMRASGIVIIDEFSMTDLFIFHNLLENIDLDKCKLILVGDVNQLPSIGAGNLLQDLISLGIPTFRLTKNHRSVGVINENAENIINGVLSLKEDEHFKICTKNSSVGWYFSALDALKDDECAVISPYRSDKIDGSAFYINNLVQHQRFSENYFRYGKFYAGDNVIFTSTNYKRGYFNGETGVVQGFRNGTYFVQLADQTVEVDDEDEMDLGYSITTHKSQGSEYEKVVICIPRYSDFVTRRMLYTAVTRAKTYLELYASWETIFKIIMNGKDEQRRTFLSTCSV